MKGLLLKKASDLISQHVSAHQAWRGLGGTDKTLKCFLDLLRKSANDEEGSSAYEPGVQGVIIIAVVVVA